MRMDEHQRCVCAQVDTTAPLQTITVEKSLYEMKQFEFKLLNPFPADCDFEVTLAQSSVDPEADAKAQAEKKRKAMTRQKSRGATTAPSLPLVRCIHPSILSAANSHLQISSGHM